ncbi:MAG: flavodoxin domain-containing protein [Actinomycetota bacterium]
MKIAIVFDSRTGTTKAVAEQMAKLAVAAGHDGTARPVQAVSAGDISGWADALAIGSWTEGWFIVRQHATQQTMEFIDELTLDGEPVAVFCTYQLSPGRLLAKMTRAVEARGGRVTGAFRSRGREVPDGFAAWLDSLEPA